LSVAVDPIDLHRGPTFDELASHSIEAEAEHVAGIAHATFDTTHASPAETLEKALVLLRSRRT
jgi:hypothetical protein